MDKKTAAVNQQIHVDDKATNQAQKGIEKSNIKSAIKNRAEFYKKKYEGTELNKKKT